MQAVDFREQFGPADITEQYEQRRLRAKSRLHALAHERGIGAVANISAQHVAWAAQWRAAAGGKTQAIEVIECFVDLRSDVAGVVRGMTDHGGRAGNV